MGKYSLVIVESPSKAKTIAKYLGSGYVVLSSKGHVIDLPKSKIGVDLESDFEPQYKVIAGKKKTVDELVHVGCKSQAIFLAMDPDREGEAIAWHLSNALKQGKVNSDMHRIYFNEVTKKAVQKAISVPSAINENLVNAQQARRILDRIVGYKVSPFLWGSISRGLSAGRVQSVALLLICLREKEIEDFVTTEWWSIDAIFAEDQSKGASFKSKLFHIEDKKFEIGCEEEAYKVLEEAKQQNYLLDKIEKKNKKSTPPKPFTTSTLQQKSAYRLRFSSAQTMRIAQQLYEGVKVQSGEAQGLITYMRTDSTRISEDAVIEVRSFISSEYGEKYCGQTKKMTKNKKTASNVQDAHECIRPTDVFLTPKDLKPFLDADQYKLYSLIWQQFVRSQMAHALLEETSFFIRGGRFTFKTTGTIVSFDGHLKLQGDRSSIEKEDKASSKNDEFDEGFLPNLSEGISVFQKEMDANQHFTKPPARYSDATLVKALEEYGIGRPSTYAPTIKTILDREYVEKIKQRFHSTDLGKQVNSVLSDYFSDIVNVNFTAEMETNLDSISQGHLDWKELLRSFYDSLKKTLGLAEGRLQERRQTVEETDRTCELCSAPVVIRNGRYGRYYSCSKYPDCNYSQDLEEEKEETNEVCDKCGQPMKIKKGRFGKFLACSDYPTCKNAKSIVEDSGVSCPESDCEGTLVKKRSKKGVFWGCSSYPKCRHITSNLPQKKEEESF